MKLLLLLFMCLFMTTPVFSVQQTYQQYPTEFAKPKSIKKASKTEYEKNRLIANILFAIAIVIVLIAHFAMKVPKTKIPFFILAAVVYLISWRFHLKAEQSADKPESKTKNKKIEDKFEKEDQ